LRTKEWVGIRICVGGEDCSFKPVYIEMEGAESLASDLLDSLEAYQGGLGVLEGAESLALTKAISIVHPTRISSGNVNSHGSVGHQLE
ncbi:hypothetical protein Tco_1088278, partial [Tanacetum coccineum]